MLLDVFRAAWRPVTTVIVHKDESMNEAEILEGLHDVIDPELNTSLAELKMLKSAAIDANDNITVTVELPTPAYPQPERITELVKNAVSLRFPQAKEIGVEFQSKVKGKDTGGRVGLKVKNIIAVGSGKGGVGKSTVAASLAYGLNHFGCKVGLMDADVYGPSIPHMVGAEGQPAARELIGPDGQSIQRIVPIEAHGVKIMSMGFFVDPDKAIIWRGPMLHRAITQFLQDTEWGELDYLVIDMPPGTGDISLTLSQSVSLAGAVVVCTPQQVALLDAVKAIQMFRQVQIPVLGVVENMTGEIFGRGGAKKKAEEMNIPFLGEIPIDANVRIFGDVGNIPGMYFDDSTIKDHLLELCQRTAMQIVRNLQDGPKMPTLEIL